MVHLVRRYRQLPLFGADQVEVTDERMTVIGATANEEWITEQGFTRAERQALDLLIRRYAPQQIAVALGKKPKTIYTQIQSMVNKARVESVGDLIALATDKNVRLETRIRAVS